MNTANANGDKPPRTHQEREPARRAVLLEEDIRGHLEEEVADEEDHERDCELVVGRVRLRHHVVARRRVEHLGVADVAAVEVREEVDGRAQRDDALVLLAQEGPLRGG